jgi:ribosomal-protein-alanine N-acetyltransferase
MNVRVDTDYGYAEGVWLSGEYELHNIEVLPEFRGKGKGFELMQMFLAKCDGVVFLEVATRNTHAIRLYEKCGFVEISRRKNYYKDDDAIVMKRGIGN